MTVRSAGGVLDEAVPGSIAYGVLERGIPLVLVLGHQSCGGGGGRCARGGGRECLPAHIWYVAGQIKSAIVRAQHGEARVDATVSAQV